MICKILFGSILLLTAGCVSASPLDLITPTPVPPLAEELGYHVPNFHGITTMGIVKGKLKVEQLRLKAFDSGAQLSLGATESARDGIMTLLTVLGIGGTAALPMALKRVPKGSFTKDEYTAAGKMSPDDFEG